MPKLTKRVVDSVIPPQVGETFLWCSELRGFGVRVKASGVKTFLVQYRNTHGRTRRFAIGQRGRVTAEEARDLARQVLAAVARGDDPSGTRKAARRAITVRELCADYLEKADAGLILTRSGKPKKTSTLYVDRGRIERHIIPLIGHRAVKDLTSSDIRAFLRDVTSGRTAADVKTKARGRAIVEGGSGTAARTLGLLGGILSFAVQEGIRPDNPARGIVKPANGRRSVHLGTRAYRALGSRLEAAEAVAEPWQAIDMIRLIALTGCRRGEIERLRWTEVDEEGRCLRLDDSKTGSSLRPLSREALALLKRIRAKDYSSPFVFPSVRREEGPFAGLPKAWKRIVVGDGLDGLTPHGLRHAYASLADELGMSLPTIAGLLGHRLGGTTAGYVSKPDIALLAAADRVGRFIAQAMDGEAATVVSHPASAA